MKPGRAPRDLLILAAIAAVYLAAGKLGLSIASVHRSASPVWPPTGIALAAILVFGYRTWPAILVGAFLVNITTAGNVATSLGIAIGNTLEGLAGAWLVNRFANGRAAFDRPADVFKFVFLAGMIGTAISPTIGVTSLALGGFACSEDFGAIWLTWWLGDVGGAVVVAPALILWAAKPRTEWGLHRILEVAGLFLAVVLLGVVIFGRNVPPAIASNFRFLWWPIMLWAAFRFGRRETATTALLWSAAAVWGTLRGSSPFTGRTENESLLLLQMYLVVIVVTALSLSAAVAEGRRAFQSLERQAADLARSNAELQEFAHVASHDLQEPLRMITTYLQILERNYHGKLGPDADECIRVASTSALRMRQLILDLLAYSRAGTHRSIPCEIDPASVVRTVLGDMKLAIEESGARIVVGSLPAIRADPTLLGQLFQNLISNALRFRGSAPPEVRIGADEVDGAWTFSVSDNGIGIDMRYAERVFEIFQRLHPQDRYPGTGVGLAICKKIVQQHGGRIWVESEPGKGSTFCFTLNGPGWVQSTEPSRQRTGA